MFSSPLYVVAFSSRSSLIAEFDKIADPDRKVATLYDMLDEQDATNKDAKGLPLTVRIFIPLTGGTKANICPRSVPFSSLIPRRPSVSLLPTPLPLDATLMKSFGESICPYNPA